jgi:murein L,D-transpeptidase YcbB/YkuD
MVFGALLCAALGSAACDPNNPIITPANAALPTVDLEALAQFERALPALLSELAALEAEPLALDAALALYDDTDHEVLTALYQRRAQRPVWITPDGALSEHGTSWLAQLRALPAQHAIAAYKLGLNEVERALGASASQPTPLMLEQAERERLVTWLAAREASQPLKHPERLVAALRAADSPVPRLAQWLSAEVARQSLQRQRAASVELALSAALIRYARVMRFDNPAWARSAAWPAELADPAQGKPDASLIARRKRHLLTEALGAVFDDPKALDAALITLEPPFAQYTRLLQAHTRYEAIVAQGGFPFVPRGILDGRPGSKGPATRALRARLRVEGFLSSDTAQGADNQWDDALTAALASYQETHQIAPAPKVGEDTLRSLNTPASQRLTQIKLALHRWRQTPIGQDQYYIHVNLPDFHAEIWDHGQLARRFRVVIGSSVEIKDEKTGEMKLPRATPEFSGGLKYIVFNPYWNVPKNILDKELRAKIDKDPTWLEKNNYEWYETSPGNKILRQKPGPSNALGVVKFLFPNSHDIYLHDSPDRHLLERPIRAYSHGCVRIEDPMGLAQYLMEREGRWDAEAVSKWMERPSETWQTLKTPVPVHIDYIMVRVDDAGRAHFMTDVYRRERAQLAAQEAEHVADGLAARAMTLTQAPGAQVAAR